MLLGGEFKVVSHIGAAPIFVRGFHFFFVYERQSSPSAIVYDFLAVLSSGMPPCRTPASAAVLRHREIKTFPPIADGSGSSENSSSSPKSARRQLSAACVASDSARQRPLISSEARVCVSGIDERVGQARCHRQRCSSVYPTAVSRRRTQSRMIGTTEPPACAGQPL